MSYRLEERLLNELSQAQGRAGGQIITAADGAVTGDFSHIHPLSADVDISAITLKNNWTANSATRLLALNPLPQMPIAVAFTSITLTGSGTAIIYNTVS
jgi:subtilase family serine protease